MFHGSYLKEDVIFLLKPIEINETDIESKESFIQSGKKHYSEMISPEYIPSKEYLDIFYKSFDLNKLKMAKHLLLLAEHLSKKENPVLVSLARAGTPVGVVLKRILRDKFNLNVNHYSISIIRDKGVDKNAIKHILERENGNDKGIIFIDGWTGKGVISNELSKFVENFNNEFNTKISPNLYVLADISGKAYYSVTYEDYLIPSSVLNSTISGLISRSILNENFIKENDFHGCKYYKEFEENDLSLWFVNELMKIIMELDLNLLLKKHFLENIDKNELEKISDNFIKDTMQEYNVLNVNFVKPGIGETTRVLLRRIPDRILFKNINSDEIEHLKVLSIEKNVLIEEIKNMPYKAVGIISNVKR